MGYSVAADLCLRHSSLHSAPIVCVIPSLEYDTIRFRLCDFVYVVELKASEDYVGLRIVES